MKKIIIVSIVLVIIACQNIKAQEISLEKAICYREVARSGNNVSVSILVNLKGVTKGKKVKIKETIPLGFSAMVKQAYGSDAEAYDNIVTFVWSKLPEADLFLVKYELTSATSVNESVSISGTMSYMSEFGMKYISVSQTDFSTNPKIAGLISNIPAYKAAYVAENQPVAEKQVEVITSTAGTEENSPKPKPRLTDAPVEKVTPLETPKETTPEPVVVKEEPKPVVEEKPIVEESKPVEKVVTPVETVPVVTETKPVAAEISASGIAPVSDMSGVFYTVQIGAAKEKLKADYYNKFSFDRSVIEMHVDNMYKYSLGRFSTLKEANSYMATLKPKNVQCFVVAYMDGKRVTVNEALTVTKK